MRSDFFNRLRNSRVDNWRLKLIALVLALATFYAIRGATSFEIPFTVPLEVEVEKGIAILEQPKSVEVTFRGSQSDLRGLDRAQIRAVARPKTSESSGSAKVAIGPRDIMGMPQGVAVASVRPDTVLITFDREIEKTFTVLKPRVVGAPLAGKVEIDYEPQYVRISGPMRWLRDREVVETEPVDVSGRSQSFTMQAKILSPSDTGVTRIVPPEITVKVNLVTESVSMDVTNVPVRAIMASGAASVPRFKPDSVKVSLHGGEESVRKIGEDSVKVFVDCAGLDSSEVYDLPVNVHLPPGMDVTATVDPKSVKVLFEADQPQGAPRD